MDGKFLKVPLDFQSWHEFRVLASKVADTGLATFIFIMLWRELGYQVGVTRELGLMTRKGADLLARGLAERGGVRQEAGGVGLEVWTGAGLMGLLAEVELVRIAEAQEGEGWVCERFAALHEHLHPDFKPQHMRAADMSRWVRRQKKEEGLALQQSLLVPEQTWRTPEGAQMDAESIKRVRLAVIAVDGALGVADRPSDSRGWSEGLVQDAYRVVKRFPAEQLDSVWRWLLRHASHPAVPATTEQLFERFEEVLAAYRQQA